MITRFYVDNYKSLVDFTYEPKPMELIVGANGSGKTTVFEALEKIKQFAFSGDEIDEVFDYDQETRWKRSGKRFHEVRFELTVCHQNDEFKYILVVDLEVLKVVLQEDLLLNGEPVVESRTQWLNTYPHSSDNPFDNERSATMKVRGETKTFPVSSPSQSILLLSSPEIYRFTSLLSKIHTVSISPNRMSSKIMESNKNEEENAEIAVGFRNFASYFARALQEKPDAVAAVRSSLSSVMDGFSSLSVERSQFGDRYLKAIFRSGLAPQEERLSFGLKELSDGQRVLIALYTLLHCAVSADSTLLIDEPENFIALRELQPWLFEMQDKVEESGGQVLLISHNPEFINQMAPQNAVQFTRPNNLETVVGPFKTEGFDGLTPAEVVARGWNQ